MRWPRLIYWLSTILLAWLLMQVVHECGHLVGAWLTGGRVAHVVIHPLTISRTDVSPNPQPVIEIWAGPLFGAVFPVLLWWISRRAFPPLSSWLRFFAGFCLIANGCYLGYGVIEPIGDAEELARLGIPSSMFVLFAVITVPCGFGLWHGLGPDFGIGPAAKPISWKSAIITLAALLAVIGMELAAASVATRDGSFERRTANRSSPAVLAA